MREDDQVAEINARTAELVEYRAKVQERAPGATGAEAFEGWVVQKVAGLQIALEEVVGELGRVRGDRENGR